ncbi:MULTISPECIES: AraC family transcriptional regulator [Bordetella]|uniref:AraC family transcriptional regulator n=2 Tax=Bordetella TaxID=517 RepID=A0A261VR17_9BORD|nr:MULTISPECIES: helix-turn-helix transcriptional regulator [Bordetella]MDM9560719.1 helix-turn-helix transcriptional regulator [Bordetella petrii]OZI76554.1 AraC family transcriptional regulator [Bordetella genomosp. 2]
MPRRLAPPLDPTRSRVADDYQHVPRPVTAMAKDFVPSATTGPHTHPRGQLIYAIEGVMRISTPGGFWTLPPLRALWVPPDTLHGVQMVDKVLMRTLYVHADAARSLWDRCQVIEVSPLLRELVLALAAEPIEYDLAGRGGQIAALLLTELRAAPVIPIQIPWPQDRRLQTVCRAILAQPGLTRTVHDWGDEVGASGRTLIRLFQAELGLNYRQWVQQVRLADALRRLSLGQPVARVAAELGYHSPSAFSAMFRRALGAPPQHYLRNE